MPRKKKTLPDKAYGAHFCALMDAAGASPGELASAAGVTAQMVSRYRGGVRPGVENVVEVARALGVTVDQLLDVERPPVPNRDKRALKMMRRVLDASDRELAELEALADEAMRAFEAEEQGQNPNGAEPLE